LRVSRINEQDIQTTSSQVPIIHDIAKVVRPSGVKTHGGVVRYTVPIQVKRANFRWRCLFQQICWEWLLRLRPVVRGPYVLFYEAFISPVNILGLGIGAESLLLQSQTPPPLTRTGPRPSSFRSFAAKTVRKPAQPNRNPIDPTASAANASGSVQTTLSKLPRPHGPAILVLLHRGSPDRDLSFNSTWIGMRMRMANFQKGPRRNGLKDSQKSELAPMWPDADCGWTEPSLQTVERDEIRNAEDRGQPARLTHAVTA
jgi:hypothetical protein